MARKRKNENDPLAGVPMVDRERFGTGEVAQILGVPVWKVQSYLDRPSYRLKVEGKLGTGIGARRRFTEEDICRIAVAKLMVQDGFSTTFVGSMLQQIDDKDFYDYGEEGELDVWELFGLERTKEGPVLRFCNRSDVPALGQSGSPYYYLFELRRVVDEIKKRIVARRPQALTAHD